MLHAAAVGGAGTTVDAEYIELHRVVEAADLDDRVDGSGNRLGTWKQSHAFLRARRAANSGAMSVKLHVSLAPASSR